jgi:hypothetical protein
MKRKDDRYSEFAHSIDVDQFMEAIGFDPQDEVRGFATGHCPDPWDMHKNGDTTGKFGIHLENRTFNCFVCGGGSLLSLAMAIKDWTEEEATDWLYEMTAPVDLSNEDFMSEIEQILAIEHREKKVWPYFNEHVLDKWTDPEGGWPVEMYDWLDGRGIAVDVAISYRIGYDPQHIRKSKSKEDYVGPAIILPHTWGGRLVGWQCRWLDDERPKWVPKYTNTRDFPKAETVFNYENVYLSPEPIVVVESVPSALFLISVGVPAVATYGSDVTDEQIRLLRKCQQGLILAPDNDAPGRKWLKSPERKKWERGEPAVPLAERLARFIPLAVTAPIGELDSGGDLGDLVGDEAELLRVLTDAEYYYNTANTKKVVKKYTKSESVEPLTKEEAEKALANVVVKDSTIKVEKPTDPS